MAQDPKAAAYRMEPLAVLPVFFKLAGKRVVVAGGGAPAAWKAELLAATGASVSVFAEDSGAEMAELAATSDRVVIAQRRWAPGDLAGAALAIGGIEDEAEAERFAQAARTAGVPVNVIDKPAFCDFQFGTVVSRSPLVIGISTDGAAPVFGQAIRARIEALLPQSLRRWAEAARDWRPAVQARGLEFQGRRRFWEAFSQRALSHSLGPTAEDQAACFDAVTRAGGNGVGHIRLVGTGPGRPGTVTLDVLGAMQTADVVIYDLDVDDATVGLSRREARKVANESEEVALAMAAALAKAGQTVTWVGTGHPLVCARWLRRLDLLSGTSTSTVPGSAGCPICPVQCLHQAEPTST